MVTQPKENTAPVRKGNTLLAGVDVEILARNRNTITYLPNSGHTLKPSDANKLLSSVENTVLYLPTMDTNR